MSRITLLALVRIATAAILRWRRDGRKIGPNILLIVLDTARFDYAGGIGDCGSKTPFIDKISRQGVVFTSAFAPAPWTLPSHVSLFTELYPHQQHVVH